MQDESLSLSGTGSSTDTTVQPEGKPNPKCRLLGNSVYTVEFDESSPIPSAVSQELSSPDAKPSAVRPDFGSQYNFRLEGVVDCPEFLVDFDTLCKIAERHGLMIQAWTGFENFFKTKRETEEGAKLLRRIKVSHFISFVVFCAELIYRF